jgi:hypothetical protein
MKHGPGRFVGAHAELSLQLHRRESRRQSADQVGGMEPLPKRHAGTMQNSPSRRGSLPAAVSALPQVSLREKVNLRAPTVRARETIWPPRLGQVASAGIFVGKQRVEFHDSAGEIGTSHTSNANRSSLRSQSDRHVP